MPIDDAVFVPVCAAVARAADAGSTFVPIPDSPSQRPWAASLAGAAYRSLLQRLASLGVFAPASR